MSENEKVEKIQQNGVTRPNGEKTGLVWDIADDLRAKDGSVSAKEVVEKATSQGVNESTARTQLNRYRKFHGMIDPARSEAAKTRRSKDAEVEVEDSIVFEEDEVA